MPASLESLLGTYAADQPTRVENFDLHTPDPSKYHDPRSMRLGTTGDAVINALYNRSSAKGSHAGAVMLPRASTFGAQMGFSPNDPIRQVFIDPELNNRSIQIDIKEMREQPERLAKAVKEAYYSISNPSDAALMAYGQFSTVNCGFDAVAKTIEEGNKQRDIIEREKPNPSGLGPDVYVVSSKGATVTPQTPIGFSKQALAPVPVQEFMAKPSVPEPPREPRVEPPVSFSKQAPAQLAREPVYANPTAVHGTEQQLGLKSVKEMFEEPTERVAATQTQPLQKITFDLGAMGEFQCQYHSILKTAVEGSPSTLVLVYDHSRPLQMNWMPPCRENPDTGEPQQLLALVDRTAYKLFATGIRFKDGTREYCVLTIDQERAVQK